MKLWNEENSTELTFYSAKKKKSDAAVVIFPGGGYHFRAEHEGKGYAEFLSENGVNAFVCDYRVAPDRFPKELLDARRAVRFVRANAEKFGVDPEKIAVMGSSAGGHLAALISTYRGEIEGEGADETDTLPYLPNAQILCYPVIVSPSTGAAHEGSYDTLLGENNAFTETDVDPYLLVHENTPRAFIWHTAADNSVDVTNSYMYATALRKYGIPVEMHVFPEGRHGLGLAKDFPHVAQWSGLLLNWLEFIGWKEK